MNLTFFDWSLVFIVVVIMVAGVVISQRHMRSVADFLAAGRTGGRYLIAVSYGIANLGAITVIAYFEQNYLAGFTMSWWDMTTNIVLLILSVSGWVVYRFRQSRALTLAQFFEMRYSRNFRVFAGAITYVSGIINFGIFPAVGARFFIYFCGLPESVNFLGLEFAMFPLLIILLLLFSLYFVFAGGQIAVIITDFIQGSLVNIAFLIIIIFMLLNFEYDAVMAALQTAPEEASLLNPFKTSRAKDFNFTFFLISIFSLVYNRMAWQGEQAYNSSAASAHEAKMGQVLANWKEIIRKFFFLVVPVCAFVVMNHPDFSQIAAEVTAKLGNFETEAIRNQMTTPLILTHILPLGFMGLFAAVMLAAFVSTHDTYLHSWGSILIQDVILPLRKEPLSQEQHIKWLRLSIIGVAVFTFFFSMFFQQNDHILLFFAITGAIFAGGSGAVIIGGLYWKRGTTAAAYSAMTIGAVVAVGGIVIRQLNPDFPINGQMFYFIAMCSAIVAYISVSLLGKKQEANLDKILNRGTHTRHDEYKIVQENPSRLSMIFGMGKEFSKTDKFIYVVTYVWIFSWFAVFLVGVVINLTGTVSDESWMRFWFWYVIIHIFGVIFFIAWMTIGGVIDLKAMISRLRKLKRDEHDDGTVPH